MNAALISRSKPISKVLISPTKTLYISLFSTSSPSPSPSHSNYQGYSSSHRRDEESRNVRVSVWWDIENCGVPTGANVYKIAHSITAAVRANGIKGPVHITGFGDIFCISRSNQEALSSTGVNLIHIPHGGKNSADRSLLVDLMCWVSQNPPPAHIFLISGDRDFAGILHKLRMSNYNILLAAREGGQTPGVLYSAASIMWHWSELARGENLSGMHFNQPPDGPFNSWYGHYRGPLEDPYTVFGQQKTPEKSPEKFPETENLSHTENTSECKYRPVPLAVLRQLRRVISSYPAGLTITELRSELGRRNVSLDRTFYGYKKFSAFLYSLPRIVEVQPRSDGQFFLLPASGKFPTDQGQDNLAESMADSESSKVQSTARENSETHLITRMENVKPSSSLPCSLDGKEETAESKVVKDAPAEKVLDASGKETPVEKVLDKPLRHDEVASTEYQNGKEISDIQVVGNRITITEDQNSKNQIGFFRKLWSKLFGSNVNAEKMSTTLSGRLNSSMADPKKSTSEEVLSKLSEQDDRHGQARSSFSFTSDLSAESDTSIKSVDNPGLMAKMKIWFWGTDSSNDKPMEDAHGRLNNVVENAKQSDDTSDSKQLDIDVSHSKKLDEVVSPSKKLDDEISPSKKLNDEVSPSKKLDDEVSPSRRHELFTKDSFWHALQSFFRTHRGSDVILNSTSREQFAEKLQKEGPLILRPLPANDIRQLVDSLVSEKKWIKEFPNKNPRFKLEERSHNSTGLSSLFLNSTASENSQLRVSSIGHKRSSEKSRCEILADCQKLLDDILPRHPKGMNISLFKKLFFDKYGYALDHQKLGHPKMVSLLQVMPGVKVEHTHVFPDTVAYAPGIESLGLKDKSRGSDSELSDSALKDEDVESPWEELGPVSNQEKQVAESNQMSMNGEYEPSLSDDDEFSDMEESPTSAVKVNEENRSTVNEENRSTANEEDSSLLQILDSWYSTKNENHSKEPASCSEDLTDDSEDDFSPSESSNVAVISGEAADSANNGRNHKSQKIYSFASETPVANKDKLIDGILGSLKKSGESRVQG